MIRPAAILVLNYNGKDLLEECLPSVIRAAERAGPGHSVWVVDNASSDGSREYLRREFPSVQIINMPENRFIFAYNDAIHRVKEDLVVLLNNDIVVEEDFLMPLLEPMKDPSVFAVGAKLLCWDRQSLNAGRRWGYLRRGMFFHDQDGGGDGEVARTLFAPCGAGVFDKQKYLEIGGMDELFWPYYYDDVDLSYRAWKRGWTVLYQPRSILYHKVQATIGRIASQASIQRCNRKNNLLFYWKNITDRGPYLLHLLLLPPRLLKSLLLFRFRFPAALWMALRQLPEALRSRRRSRSQIHRTDREILELFAPRNGNGSGAGG